MYKKVYPAIFRQELLYTIPGFVYFLYILFPYRFWEPFVFSNQTETVVITTYFACVLLGFFLLKIYKTRIFPFNRIDLLLVIYGIYLLFRLRHPLEKEYFYTAFSIVCIYLYFRNFPEKYFTGLLFLIPLAGIAQMINGVLGFAMPWQNLSHITGIFGNTGLFGGFAALGFFICIGMIHSYAIFSGLNPQSTVKGIKSYLRSFILFIFGVLSIPLAVQVYASGSRASWIAVLVAILFLLSRYLSVEYGNLCKSAQSVSSAFQKLSKTPAASLFSSLFIASCLLIAFAFSAKHLYFLKKDSADGRILIGTISIDMIKEAPILGNGISGFRAEYLNHQAAYFQLHPDSPYSILADDVETSFNEFLKILVEQGITGLLLFSCVLYGVFKTKNRNNIHHPGTLATVKSIILFFLIFGLFSYPFDKPPFLVLFIFSLAAASQVSNSCALSENSLRSLRLLFPDFLTNHPKKGLRTALLLATCMASCIPAINAYRYSKSCREWNRALTNFGSGSEESLSQLEALYPELCDNPVFLTTYGKALNFGRRYREAAVVLEKAVERLPLSTSYIELGKCYEATGFPEKALSCWSRASRTVPSRFTPLYLTMKLHFKNGEYEPAQQCAEKLLSKKIKIDNPEIDQMKREARDILNPRPPP